jgi:hypothetical protein
MVTFDARPSAFTQLATTADWEYLFTAAGIRDGVDQFSSLTPTLDTGGRNAVIGAGNCIIKGMLWRCDAAVNTSIPAASASNRIDRLVLRLNRAAGTSAAVIQPVVITGTPSGSPVEPPLSQTVGGNWDIPISSWTSASNGALSNLLDERQYTGTVRDTWHDMRPLGNSWIGTIAGQMPAQYRFSDDYKWVEVTGVIQNPTAAIWTGKAFKNLPLAYRPPVGDRWPCSGASLNPSPYYPYAPVIQAWANGNLTLELCEHQTLEINSLIGITGRYAISAAGLILS